MSNAHVSYRACAQFICTTQIPFEFNPNNLKRAQEIISHYPPQYKKAAVIPLLDLGQRQNQGWTSISVMNYVAKLLELAPMRVYEVATFYTMFNRCVARFVLRDFIYNQACSSFRSEPIGTNFVQVCTTTPCMLSGSTDILNAACEHLDVKPGGTTKDGKFTVVEVECQGACSNAPMMAVNDDFYVSPRLKHNEKAGVMFFQEDLTPTTTRKILDAFSRAEKPKAGPQSGRHTSENSAGLTALTTKVHSPFHISYIVLRGLISLSLMALASFVHQNLVEYVALGISHWTLSRRMSKISMECSI
jgi:NADH dehydrogenase (ubiquinone) flavoprotein 2